MMTEERLAANQALIVMHERDDVATALRDLAAGEQLAYRVGERAGDVRTTTAIPFGHKLALHPIAAGDEVHKYGAVIGRAVCAIAPGAHVHVHNLAGVRGRGDLAATAARQPTQAEGDLA